jgi:diguanylate cyclase (GGDEF)-like protein
VAEKLRSAVEKTAFEGEELLPAGTLTVSIGAASFPGDAANARELLERADGALYRSKESGRNRVTAWAVQEIAAAV